MFHGLLAYLNQCKQGLGPYTNSTCSLCLDTNDLIKYLIEIILCFNTLLHVKRVTHTLHNLNLLKKLLQKTAAISDKARESLKSQTQSTIELNKTLLKPTIVSRKVKYNLYHI